MVGFCYAKVRIYRERQAKSDNKNGYSVLVDQLLFRPESRSITHALIGCLRLLTYVTRSRDPGAWMSFRNYHIEMQLDFPWAVSLPHCLSTLCLANPLLLQFEGRKRLKIPW